MQKKYDTKANQRNTPHLKENILIICLSEGFIGLNFILAGIYTLYVNKYDGAPLIGIGIIYCITVLISLVDRRKDMCGIFYVFICCTIHLICSIAIVYLLHYWWLMILYIIEIVLEIGIVFICHRWWNRKYRLPKRR